jgi:hypothetical protein
MAGHGQTSTFMKPHVGSLLIGALYIIVTTCIVRPSAAAAVFQCECEKLNWVTKGERKRRNT